MAKTSAITELGDDELFQKLAENKAELFNLRFQLATGQLDNVTRIGKVKKDVARCLTEIRTREIAAYEAQASTSEESA
jgi:large subunit ribosomal protein L29